MAFGVIKLHAVTIADDRGDDQNQAHAPNELGETTVEEKDVRAKGVDAVSGFGIKDIEENGEASRRIA